MSATTRNQNLAEDRYEEEAYSSDRKVNKYFNPTSRRSILMRFTPQEQAKKAAVPAIYLSRGQHRLHSTINSVSGKNYPHQ